MVPTDSELESAARRLGAALAARGARVAVAESCTGGWVAKALTDVAGSSAWFERGFVTYSNDAKIDMLAVPAGLIAGHGAVSEPVARAMADGARRRSGAELAVAVSGIAGPDGGTLDKPVGTVCFAWADRDTVQSGQCHFAGDREAVRRLSVAHALEGLLARASIGAA